MSWYQVSVSSRDDVGGDVQGTHGCPQGLQSLAGDHRCGREVLHSTGKGDVRHSNLFTHT